MTLVDDVRQAWRWWSVRLAMVAGIGAGALVAQPQLLTGLVAYVPEQWRPLASAAAGIVVFGAPTIARVLQQGSKPDGNAA